MMVTMAMMMAAAVTTAKIVVVRRAITIDVVVVALRAVTIIVKVVTRRAIDIVVNVIVCGVIIIIVVVICLQPHANSALATQASRAVRAEILGDPYSKKSPLPSICTSPCLVSSHKDNSYQVLSQSRIHHRHTTRKNYPRILAQ